MSLANYEETAKDFGNPNWVAYKTIVRTEIRRFTRIWVQTMIPPAITMTLYFIIFGSLIGNRIGEMNGFDYMAYIIPGLIMMSVITSSYMNVSSSFFGSKFGRFIEEMLVSPISSQTILLGYVTGGVARAIFVGIIVTMLSTFFTDVLLAVFQPFFFHFAILRWTPSWTYIESVLTSTARLSVETTSTRAASSAR